MLSKVSCRTLPIGAFKAVREAFDVRDPRQYPNNGISLKLLHGVPGYQPNATEVVGSKKGQAGFFYLLLLVDCKDQGIFLERRKLYSEYFGLVVIQRTALHHHRPFLNRTVSHSLYSETNRPCHSVLPTFNR
jgi:hypothetical protein